MIRRDASSPRAQVLLTRSVGRRSQGLGLWAPLLPAMLLGIAVGLIGTDAGLILGLTCTYFVLLSLPIVGLPQFGDQRFDWLAPPLVFALTRIVSSWRPIQVAFVDDWSTKWLSGKRVVAPLLAETLLLGILGTIAFFLGYAVIRRRGHSLSSSPGNWVGQSELTRRRWIDRRTRLASWALILAGALAVGYLFAQGGGIAAYLDELASRRKVVAGRTFLMFGAHFASAGTLIRFAYERERRSALGMSISLAAFLVSVVIGLATGSRTEALVPLVAAAALWHYHVAKIRLWALALGAVVLLTSFGLFGEMRSHTLHEGTFSISNVEGFNPSDVLAGESRERGRSDRLLVVLRGIPEQIDFQYFRTYSRVATSLVPRFIWPDKPGLTEANVYAPLFGWTTEGYAVFPAGVTGDFYLQLGIAGVALGWMATGLLAGYAQLVRTRINHSSVTILYGYFLMTLGQGLNNLQIMSFLLRVVPIAIIVLAITQPARVTR